MHKEFTVSIESDGKWYLASCPEVPEANGQGSTPEAAKEDLLAAIALVLDGRRTNDLYRNYLRAEAALASRADFERVLAKAPALPPEPGDTLH